MLISGSRAHCPVFVGGLLAAVAVLMATGCPTFEDSRTGHYQEVDIGEFQDEAVALDLFRFGDEVRGVLRQYDVSSSTAREQPFDAANETRCRWSSVDVFNADASSFSLSLPATAEWAEVELEGEFVGDEGLELAIDGAEYDEPLEVEMRRDEEPPDADCAAIDDFLIRPIFDAVANNRLDPDTYRIEHPVFVFLWVGVERVGRLWAPLNYPDLPVRLADEGLFSDNGLTGSLSMSVPAPAERILVDSGQTRYGLAHPVVIDDSDDDEGFGWDVAEEPVIATALSDDVPVELPERVDEDEVVTTGQALLFVEGRLDELGDDLRQRLLGLEEAEPDRHFYIVDVFTYYRDEVEFLRLPPRPQPGQPVQRRIPIEVTDEHLEAGQVPVPRLFSSD